MKSTYVPTAFSNWNQPVWAPYVQRYDSHLKTKYLGYATIDSVPYIFIATWSDANINAAAVDSIIDLFPNAPARTSLMFASTAAATRFRRSTSPNDSTT